jgi:hypothetical protein
VPITVTRTDETVAPNGTVTRTTRQEDVTASVTRLDIHAKARQAVAANQTFLNLASPTNTQNAAQVQRLTRECSGIIRLLLSLDGAADLLVENTDT